MTSNTLLIVNASIVNEGRVTEGDVLVCDGRIERVGFGFTGRQADRVIDAHGRHLLPGMIDDQVHFREPGMTHKGDIATESAAAVAGGITSFMDMPNTIPNTTTRAALANKYLAAAGRARANFAFYLGGANDNIEEIRALRPEQACGVKVFMGASTGNMLVDDPVTLERIFADCPMLIATHCEDSPLIHANGEKMREQYGNEVPVSAHPLIRSAEACYRSSSLAVSLARRHDARLHVLHLTTAREMELFTPGPVQGKRITAEVCVHHLHFDDSHYAELGNLIKCNPAIKTAADRAALLAALKEDRIDVVATDHAPHAAEDKECEWAAASFGMLGLQTALPVVNETMVRTGLLDWSQVAERMSFAPARIGRVAEHGRPIEVGEPANVTLFDPEYEWVVAANDMVSRSRNTPYEGMELPGAVVATFFRGRPTVLGGELQLDRW